MTPFLTDNPFITLQKGFYNLSTMNSKSFPFFKAMKYVESKEANLSRQMLNQSAKEFIAKLTTLTCSPATAVETW